MQKCTVTGLSNPIVPTELQENLSGVTAPAGPRQLKWPWRVLGTQLWRGTESNLNWDSGLGFMFPSLG